MCTNKHKDASPMRPKKPKSTRNTGRRKTRTKTRKHRFISLLRDLSSTSPENHQLNLFPLHPENLFEDKDDTLEEEASSLFATADSGGATLNGLVWNSGGDDVGSPEEDDTWSASVACGGGSWLERAALRSSRERDGSEEKERWVRYNEVVEKREKEEEVTSCSAEYWTEYATTRGLSLKLDYQEIMDAWMDKGPLYIDGDQGPGIVPDVLDDDVTKREDHCSSSVKVPVMGNGDEGKEGEVEVEGEMWKMGQDREARVLRYKEKRQSRLFAKRIRYEVRKLNAEKRPRIKGRFVKRC